MLLRMGRPTSASTGCPSSSEAVALAKVPVNTDGGLKTFGHPTGATGVRMIYENTLQLQGRAGDRQVENPKLALSHNLGGHPTACGIAILGRD